MTTHTVLLYVCAAAVVAPGTVLLAALAARGREDVPPPVAVLLAWRRPVPAAAAALVGLLAAMAVVQSVFPAVVDRLQRQPDGTWWQAFTALLVQTSGWFQLLFNLAALAAVAPIAERQLGWSRMLAVYLVSGVAAQAVSLGGWSVSGGGDSVAICGLVGALAARYLLRGGVRALRSALLLIPAAGFVLCVLTNNHGVGVLVGVAAGAALPAGRRLSRR